MKKAISFLILVILLLPIVYSKEGHLKLLAVREGSEGYEGTIADLYLELKEGTGRVFLDTFPLTKVDTQISTRFAKDIACSHLDLDCGKFDFVYTIRANSPIIAGPSAGGAIALLTASLLDGFEVDENISVTGTINSGGIIGPVGGVKEKIDAASKNGLRKVLIPEGERFIEDDKKIIEMIEINSSNGTKVNASITNKTVDLVEYGKEIGLEVVEVSDLADVLYEFTGEEVEEQDYDFEVDEEYEDTMSFLASQLCNRSNNLFNEVEEFYDDKYNSTMDVALNLTGKAEVAIEKGRHYSAASYCFGANVKLTYLLLDLTNVTSKEVVENLEIIDRNVAKLEKSIDKRKKETITDLEAYVVVKERLIDSKDFKMKLLESLNVTDVGVEKVVLVHKENFTEEDLYNLAYSYERVYSAFSWANFFDHRGRKFVFNKELLESSCKDKIAEAEERHHYVSLFFSGLDLSATRKEIDYAYEDLHRGDFELCLFKATKAKAESDIILSFLGVESGKLDILLNKKLEAAKKNIAKQISKGDFPILAYSYYEYGDELSEQDKHSALLYAEYAIELSNLDMYFKLKEPFKVDVNFKPLFYVVFGFVLGYFISEIVKLSRKPKKKRKAKKKRRR